LRVLFKEACRSAAELGQGSITANILALKILRNHWSHISQFIHELFSHPWRMTAQVENVITSVCGGEGIRFSPKEAS
jgi:hypothetical protein